MATLTRRAVLRRAGALTSGALALPALAPLAAQAPRFALGACDWSIGQRGRPGALEVVRKLGLDGVQVSMGSVDDDLHLRRADVQRAYREAAAAHGVRVGGVALDVLNRVPYKSDPRTVAWVRDSIEVARAMEVRVVLLAFFEAGDLRHDPEGQAEVVRRLREAAPAAEAARVILGLESWLPAADHLRLLDAVGSPNVQVYYDVANSHQMGYDVSAEIRMLRGRLCEVHAKENGRLLGDGPIDFAEVRRALDAIGYSGWIHIEGAVPKGASMFESYVRNTRVMRKHFGA